MSNVEDSASTQEYEFLTYLCSMFENSDPVQLLKVIRKFNGDSEACINHLLAHQDSTDEDSESDVDIPDYDLAGSDFAPTQGFRKAAQDKEPHANLASYQLAKAKQQLKKKKKEERKLRKNKKKVARDYKREIKLEDSALDLVVEANTTQGKVQETIPLIQEEPKSLFSSIEEIKPCSVPALVESMPDLLCNPYTLVCSNLEEEEELSTLVDSYVSNQSEDIPEEIYVEGSNLGSDGRMGFRRWEEDDNFLIESIPELIESDFSERIEPIVRTETHESEHLRYYVERETMLLDRIVKCEGEISRLHSENVRLRELKDVQAEENTRLMNDNNDLIKSNVLLEEEKRNAMTFFITQINDLRTQLLDQDKKASELKMEIQNLGLMLDESKKNESRLSKMLIQSKDILVDGVASLSRNISSGWSKVQTQVSESDFNVMKRLQEFAHNIRDEILKVLNINMSHRLANSTTPTPQVPQENLDAFEEEEEHAAKLASLQTYVNQELARN